MKSEYKSIWEPLWNKCNGTQRNKGKMVSNSFEDLGFLCSKEKSRVVYDRKLCFAKLDFFKK